MPGVRVTVWVDSWQFQCCGDDFAVGQTVTWRLRGSTSSSGTTLAEHTPAPVGLLPVVESRVGDADGPAPVGVVVGAGALRVFLRDDSSAHDPSARDPSARDPSARDPSAHGGSSRWVGLLSEDHHIGVPEVAPATEARVSSIRLFRLAYRADPAEGSNLPIPGSGTAEDVEQAPRWPTDTVDGRKFVGFLVDLEVADA